MPRRLAPIERVRLRRVAMRYAVHGWSVTPGACLARHRFVCGRAGCPTTGCHPASDDWERTASADPARVATWWRRRPHAVLLATGRAFDVVEVPAFLGQQILRSTSTPPRSTRTPRRSTRTTPENGTPGDNWAGGPVAVTPNGRWMFLVRPGNPLRPELANSLYVLRHGAGSWIPAPPTRLPEGAVRWAVPPEEVRWHLPDSYALQEQLLAAVQALTSALATPLLTTRPPLPRRGS